nr:ATP-dependent peptidases isoform 1 [Tanacetum cinerariifolium]
LIVSEMSQLGLTAFANPSELLLSVRHSDQEFLAGLAISKWKYLHH